MTYTQREIVTVRGEDGKPQGDIDCEITGTIVLDIKEKDGREFPAWFHNGFTEVKMKMWSGEYKRIGGEAAKVIYDAFCQMWSAQDLADLEEAA